MRVKETKIVTKEVEVVVKDYNLCDKCDKEINPKGYYNAFEFELEHKTGEAFPSGGSGKTQSVELCETCAEECINLLRKNGYRINSEDWDF